MGLNTHRGRHHWEYFCKPPPLKSWIPLTDIDQSYPIAYSLLILPLSIARYTLDKRVEAHLTEGLEDAGRDNMDARTQRE
jgi:hypothetical protein